MEKINWGMIGCGDVTEVKSGPAFNKVNNSSLVAVMSRSEDRVKSYAIRHQVPKWYTNAGELINDPEVNAIYIATPPSSHKQYALEAIAAGRHVYVEKPMTLNFGEAVAIADAAKAKNVKLVVAHYRREQPMFKQVKKLIAENTIGKISFATLQYYKRHLTHEELQLPKNAWRIDPSIAGGGLFHDLAPHQLDLMYYFFGDVEKAFGYAIDQSASYGADDLVAGNILFRSGVLFNGIWSFNSPAKEEKDYCEILGAEGKIAFAVFGEPKILITKSDKTETLSFDVLPHVQQPMIAGTVEYFLGKRSNPCSAEEGAEVMKLIDQFTKK